MVFSLGLAFIILSQTAFAEYRVFKLKIQSQTNPATVRYVESTLDHIQYRQYFDVRIDETVTYVETWKCLGRTDHLELCPNPKNIPVESPENP
jgi:hypothetical protein